jgi:hypothetical protein
MIVALISPDVCGQEPVHPTPQVAIPQGPQRELEVVGHQAVGQDAHRLPEVRLGEGADECLIVVVLVEDGGPVIAPVRDTIAVVGGGACGSRHGGLALSGASTRTNLIHITQSPAAIHYVPFWFPSPSDPYLLVAAAISFTVPQLLVAMFGGMIIRYFARSRVTVSSES